MSLNFNFISATNSNNSNSTISNLIVTNNTITTLNVTNCNISYANTISSLSVASNITSVQPFIIVYAGTAESILNNTETTFTTYWSGASSASGIAQASGIFTVTYGGIYFISADIGLSANSSGYRAVWIQRNLDTNTGDRLAMATTPATNVVANEYNLTMNLKLNAGDTVRVKVYQTSGSTLTGDIVYGNKFQMIKVS